MARRQIVSGNARVHQLAMLKGPSADIHVIQSALSPKKPKPTSGLAKPKPPKSQQTQASSVKGGGKKMERENYDNYAQDPRGHI